MVGSVANPVRFVNPFRRVTEVHWNSVDPENVTHVAVSLRVRMVTWQPDATAFLSLAWWWAAYPPEGTNPEDWPFAVRSWRTSVYTDSDGWESRLGELPIEGLPAKSYGQYEPASENAAFWRWPTMDSDPDVTHYRWSNPTGASIMPTPADPAISFLVGSPVIEAWDNSAKVGDRETITPTSLVYSGHTFSYVGAAAVREVLPSIASIGGPGNSANRVMWLLFERVTA